MGSDDLTIKILSDIRDEIRTTNQRVDHLSSRVDRMGEDLGRRIDGVRDELGGRIDGLGEGLGQRIDGLGQRVDSLGQRVDSLGQRIEEVDERAARRTVESELRISTRITEHTAATRDLYKLLEDRFELRDRVEACERDIVEIKQRLD